MPKLPKLGRELGFKTDTNIVYGMYEGYHVTIFHKMRLLNAFLNPAGNFKRLFIAVEVLTEEQAQKTLLFLNKNKKDLIIRDAYVENSVLLLIINEDIRAYSVKRYNQTMEKLVKYLKSERIKPEYRCAYCGEEGVDHISIMNSVAFPSHKACQDKI